MSKKSGYTGKTASRSEKSKSRSIFAETPDHGARQISDGAGAAEKRRGTWINRWTLARAGAVMLFLAVYLLRLDRVVGLMIDDAWYVLLAKALATGHGYTVVNSPSAGMLPLYPPAFPALLSLAYRIAPNFPQNIYLLKSVSIAAMFGVGAIAYVYFKRERAIPKHIALGMALAAAISPPLVMLATSTVMSECVFALSFLAAVLVIERSARHENRAIRLMYAVAGAALASFTFLTRSMAIGLLVAGAVYFIKKRLLRTAWIYSAAAAAFSAPWMIYSRLHAPTVAQQAEQGGHIIRGYSAQFWDRIAGYPELGEVGFTDLPMRVWNNILEIIGVNVGAIVVNPLFPGLSQGTGERWGGVGAVASLLLTAIVVIGFIMTAREKVSFAEIALPLSLLAPLSWGFAQFRYVVPYTPFVIFYLLMGVAALDRWRRQQSSTDHIFNPTRLLSATLCVVLLFNCYSHADYITKRFGGDAQSRPGLLRSFEQHEDLLKWAAENLNQDGVLLTQNPPMAYLYTERKTINYDFPAERWQLWKQLGVRYFVRNSPMPLPSRDEMDQSFHAIYRAEGEMHLRVIDLGVPASRQPWNHVRR